MHTTRVGQGEADAPQAGDTPRDEALIEPASDYERLRELLLGEERRELLAARARIAELERAQGELPRRLPAAAVTALREGGAAPQIADALAAPVAQALGAAVHNNRQSIIDALFPVIGPMIRRAVAEALRGLVDNLNGAIESSFTLRGLKWRLEAWRGGVPYAQVVLRHRLAYGIERVFLIERASGLLLQHASAPGLPALDADAIAGMLTALGDFVGDSTGNADDALEAAQVGEALVWVEHGPLLNLACFLRGMPPPALRVLLKQRLEDIHAQLGHSPSAANLQALAGAAQVRSLLEPMALLHSVQASAPDETAARRTSRLPVLVLALLVLGLLGWQVAQRWRWHARMEALRTALAQQPGFVPGAIDAQPWRRVLVHGLLDPDAPSPQVLLDGADLGDAQRQLATSGFISTDDRIVLRRAQRLLQPPAGVRLAVQDGTLRIDGSAPSAWAAQALRSAPLIAGVAQVESALQTQVDPRQLARAALEQALAAIATSSVAFVREDEPETGSAAVVDGLAAKLRSAQVMAHDAGLSLALRSVGSSDESGGDAINVRVRALRARWLALALAARGIAAVAEGDPANNPDPAHRSARIEASIAGPAP